MNTVPSEQIGSGSIEVIDGAAAGASTAASGCLFSLPQLPHPERCNTSRTIAWGA